MIVIKQCVLDINHIVFGELQNLEFISIHIKTHIYINGSDLLTSNVIIKLCQRDDFTQSI